MKPCSECGDLFRPRASTALTCSKACNRARKIKQRKAGPGKPERSAECSSGPRGDDEGPTVDHIHPRSKGGPDDLDNLQLAHWRCNRAKGNRIAA